jgi:hypothetical protein
VDYAIDYSYLDFSVSARFRPDYGDEGKFVFSILIGGPTRDIARMTDLEWGVSTDTLKATVDDSLFRRSYHYTLSFGLNLNPAKVKGTILPLNVDGGRTEVQVLYPPCDASYPYVCH